MTLRTAVGNGWAGLPAVVAAAAVQVGAAQAQTTDIASQWVDGYNSKSRLIAGGAGRGLIAGIEVKIASGWKTYWRMPGDSGGVPPNIDLSQSENVAAATVLYPAPHRMTDAAGDSVGYKDTVTFPIEIQAADPKKPVVLNVQLEYGICREICVPAEARLSLTIPPGSAAAIPAALASAVALVPAKAATAKPADPTLKSAAAQLTGDKPKLVFEIAYPGGTAGADLFVEAPDGIYLPLPRKTGEAAGTLRFEVDLATGLEAKDLVGKTLTLTAVSEKGQSELAWPVQ